MQHLYQEVSKKGTDFLNTLFLKDLIITEKLAGVSLICKKTKKSVQFFGREGTRKIDKFTRMFSTMFEAGIDHLKTKDLSFLRNNEELQFEYFSPQMNHIITYDNIPDSGLVLLSSTSKRNLNMIAHDLGVLPPPVIFKGKLSEEQKNELTKFLLMSPELRQIKFKTNIFSSFIVSLLNEKYVSVLENGNLEGIVISTLDGNFISKIIDPMFVDSILSKKSNDEMKFEYFKLLSSLVVDLEMDGVDTYDSPEEEIEERYIDFLMNIIINNISNVMNRKHEFAKYDFGKPYISKNTDFDYNLFPKVVMDIMKENPWFKDFARMTFNNYTREKTRSTKYFSKGDIQVINRKITSIKKYVLLDDDMDVNEGEITIEESVENYGVMFGRFQPLTNGHLKGIEFMSKHVDKGCIYIVKGKKTSLDKDKNPFDEDIQIEMIKKVLPKNLEVKIAPSAFYPDIINQLDYDNFKILAGSDRVQAYKKMLSYVSEEKEAEVIEIPREGLASGEDVSATKVRQALKDNDEESFKKMTPPEIHKLFDELKEIVRGD
jgi:cytidyltransferase-like protein